MINWKGAGDEALLSLLAPPKIPAEDGARLPELKLKLGLPGAPAAGVDPFGAENENPPVDFIDGS